MSTATRAHITPPIPHRLPPHLHLPSVHVRKNGSGYDYEEDFYIQGGSAERAIEHVVTFRAVERDEVMFVRVTTDVLCEEEAATFEAGWDVFLDETDPDIIAIMQERARVEFKRQMRIASGTETACAGCGCSDSRSCSGGCVWATQELCSRCA